MTESLVKTKDNAFDIDHWEPINLGENGAFFFIDRSTGVVYSSDHSLEDLQQYRLRLVKEQGLGLAPLVIPLISAVGAVGGGAFSFLGKKNDAKAAQSNAAAQVQMAQLQAQQKAQQTAMISQISTYGLIAVGALAFIMVLK